MESLLNITCLPIIVGLVYVVMQVYKHLVAKCANDIWTRLIPMWAMLLGGALGVYIFFKMPTLMIADKVLSALLVGIVSGLSSVGFNQIGKQFSKNSNAENTPSVDAPKPDEGNPQETPDEPKGD